MDTETRSAMQDLAVNARVAHDDMRDRDQRPIGHELHRLDDMLTSLEVKVTQVEDRLSPVRSPMDGVKLDQGVPVPLVSPIADTLRGHNATIDRLINRLDQLLADVEL